MRLLGWMQHKLWKNSRDFTTGNNCTCFSAKSPFNDQEFFSKPTFGTTCECKYSQQGKEGRKSTSGYTQEEVDADLEDKELVFHGFLTIGTLGSEKIINNPDTPIFPTSLENIPEEGTDVTEIDLKLINEQLEKFLEAEVEEKGLDESSERNSQVSIISLSRKPMEGTNTEENGQMICPLQGYLFGSSIELSETTTAWNRERGTLAELFDREKIADESSTKYCRREEMHVQAKETNKSVKHRIMKIMNKLQSSSKSSSTPNKETPVSTKKRLSKVMNMFKRKIHPESSDTQTKLQRSKNYKTNYALDYGENIEGELMHQDQDTCKFCQRCILQEERQGYKNNSKLPQDMLVSSASCGNREHWITTDANYLVLELE